MCLTPGEFAEWSKAVAPWISLPIVFVGWFVLNWQANRRETRKEIRQQVDRATKLVEMSADLGMVVHSSSVVSTIGKDVDEKTRQSLAEAQSKIRRLKFSLAQLSPLIQLLSERGVGSQDVTDALIELRTNLMGGDFETADQVPWSTDDSRWNELSGCSVRLAICLERAFQQKFE